MHRAEFEERWRRRFTERGATLDDDAGIAGWTSTGLQTRVRQFRALWARESREPGLWLDIGCGAGTYTRLLRDEGHRVVGLDYAVPSLRKARARQDRDDERLHWASADIRNLPLGDALADGVLCFGVMQALTDPAPALTELYRVLKPGGELWVDALNADCAPNLVREWRRRRRGQPAHLRYDKPAAFRSAVREAGFTLEGEEWLPIVPGRLHRMQWVLEAGLTQAALRTARPLGAFLSHSFIVRGIRPPS